MYIYIYRERESSTDLYLKIVGLTVPPSCFALQETPGTAYEDYTSVDVVAEVMKITGEDIYTHVFSYIYIYMYSCFYLCKYMYIYIEDYASVDVIGEVMKITGEDIYIHMHLVIYMCVYVGGGG